MDRDYDCMLLDDIAKDDGCFNEYFPIQKYECILTNVDSINNYS